MVNLEFDVKRQKVDHPATPGRSKDIADPFAAVIHHCEEGFHKAGFALLAPRPGFVGPKIGSEEDLWEKVAQGIPLSEEEIDRL